MRRSSTPVSTAVDTPYAWDLFISHASEDKADVAAPLARLLEAAGLRVWLDERELRIGDSLRGQIDDGLGRSRFGVVVLSPRFLEKRWTRNELDALFVTESASETRLLPVWHGVTASELAKHSPLLAGRVAASTSAGLGEVARAIAAVVVSATDSPSVVSPSRHLRFLRLLDTAASATDVVAFLASYPEIVLRAVGGSASEDRVVWHIQAEGPAIDCAVGRFQGTVGRFDWTIIRCVAPAVPPVRGATVRAPEVAGAIDELHAFRNWTASNLPAARRLVPGFESDLMAVVVAGRRTTLPQDDLQHLSAWNDELFGVRIRTYDWLIDACAQLDSGRHT